MRPRCIGKRLSNRDRIHLGRFVVFVGIGDNMDVHGVENGIVGNHVQRHIEACPSYNQADI
jgi:hypothetical protein